MVVAVSRKTPIYINARRSPCFFVFVLVVFAYTAILVFYFWSWIWLPVIEYMVLLKEERATQR